MVTEGLKVSLTLARVPHSPRDRERDGAKKLEGRAWRLSSRGRVEASQLLELAAELVMLLLIIVFDDTVPLAVFSPSEGAAPVEVGCSCPARFS